MLLHDLFESFTTVVPVDYKKGNRDWRGTFVVGPDTFTIYFKRFDGNEWTVAFTAHDEAGGESYLPTKKGRGAMTVLSTVFNEMISFLREVEPDMLSFTGRDDTGQASVYSRIMRSFLKPRSEALGYEVAEEQIGLQNSSFVNFIIRKPGYEEIEPLTEALNQPLAYEWTAKLKKHWAMEFDANKQRYRMQFYSNDDKARDWTVSYRIKDQDDMLAYLPQNRFKQGAVRVLSTVLAALVEFMREKKPETLTFSGSGGLGTLYGRMMRHFEPQITALGYEVRIEKYPGEAEFTLVRKFKAPTDRRS